MKAGVWALVAALCLSAGARAQRAVSSSREQELRKTLAAGQDTAENHGQLGLLLYRAGRFTEAVEELGRAAQLDPSSPEYSLKLAASLLAQRKYVVALDLLNALKSRFGGYAEYQYNLGLALYGIRQYQAALGAFHETIRLNPDMDVAYFFIGNTYVAMTDLERAAEYYRKAVALNSTNAAYYFALGKILAELGPENDKQAADLLRRALKLKPDDVPAKLELGRACERMGDLACARPLLEDVAARFPEEVAPHVILARIYTRLNQPGKAEIEREAVKRIEKTRQTTAPPRTSSESRP